MISYCDDCRNFFNTATEEAQTFRISEITNQFKTIPLNQITERDFYWFITIAFGYNEPDKEKILKQQQALIDEILRISSSIRVTNSPKNPFLPLEMLEQISTFAGVRELDGKQDSLFSLNPSDIFGIETHSYIKKELQEFFDLSDQQTLDNINIFCSALANNREEIVNNNDLKKLIDDLEDAKCELGCLNLALNRDTRLSRETDTTQTKIAETTNLIDDLWKKITTSRNKQLQKSSNVLLEHLKPEIKSFLYNDNEPLTVNPLSLSALNTILILSGNQKCRLKVIDNIVYEYYYDSALTTKPPKSDFFYEINLAKILCLIDKNFYIKLYQNATRVSLLIGEQIRKIFEAYKGELSKDFSKEFLDFLFECPIKNLLKSTYKGLDRFAFIIGMSLGSGGFSFDHVDYYDKFRNKFKVRLGKKPLGSQGFPATQTHTNPPQTRSGNASPGIHVNDKSERQTFRSRCKKLLENHPKLGWSSLGFATLLTYFGGYKLIQTVKNWLKK